MAIIELLIFIMQIITEIAQDDPAWDATIYQQESTYEPLVQAVLAAHPAFTEIASVEISILLTNDQRMQALNVEFRNQNKPTNVLSFPDLELHYTQLAKSNFAGQDLYLGDVALGYETIAQEASNQGINFQTHCHHLLIHSLLHLLGYDHQHESDAELMQNLEIKLLKQFDISSPYC